MYVVVTIRNINPSFGIHHLRAACSKLNYVYVCSKLDNRNVPLADQVHIGICAAPIY